MLLLRAGESRAERATCGAHALERGEERRIHVAELVECRSVVESVGRLVEMMSAEVLKVR